MDIRGWKTSPCILALLLCIPAVQGICPSGCSCSGNNRNVDCSGRNLTTLPHGLQDNITYLNLSYNHFADLSHQLTRFSNLRTLDISHNWLQNLPAHLPRSLWEIYATHNYVKVLQKLDTAYQWNLRVLDVSGNMLERAVLINNTLSSLKSLNLSHNKLWTVPTNIPYNTEMVDLSNNYLTQILPGTLVRLTSLSKLYLHNNKFTYIPDKAFDQLVGLQLITLYNNLWSCEEGTQALLYLQKWVKETTATVIGLPCADKATTPWMDTTEVSVAPTTAENHFLVKGIKSLDNAGSPVTTGQTQLVHQQFRMKDAILSATAGQTETLPSTGRPVAFYPEDLNTEKLNSYEAAAATHTIHIQEMSTMNVSTMALVASSSTPMTLSITGGVPITQTKRSQSTTTTARREEATTKVHPRVYNKANVRTVHSYIIIMLTVVVWATG